MADTIAVMNRGRIEQAGTADALYETPSTAFVANFLGTSNLVEARVGADGAGELATVETHDGATLLAPRARVAGRSGAVRVGVRPEKVRLVPAEDAVPAGVNELRGQVVEGSYLGLATHWLVRAHGGEQLTVVEQNRDGGDGHAWALGQQVRLTWEPRHTFVVDSARADG